MARRLLPAVGAVTLMGMTVACGPAATDGSAASSSAAPSKTIVLINPNSSASATTSMVELATAQAAGRAKIVGVTNEGAPALLTTPQDMATATAGVVRRGTEAAGRAGVAAIVVAAFSDPGTAELRNAVSVPVFGIGEQAFKEAGRGGRAFGIATVTSDPALVESFRAKAESLGLLEQYRGVRVTPGDASELVKSPDVLDAALKEAVQQSIAIDCARAVIMGGGPLSASGLRLQKSFDVPLIVAVNAAVEAALQGA
ncbi:aspartate/glutamate racemase family protein [Tsukamurella sputi]|uniref:aspartate/glutamate racemase family protein n=1 Tax=Tsukamurella sputi TaxID=2591848 RepID=UPI001961F101|nr:aspartate/glutamate racemase family protein [Tsukamurella sputi]